MAKTIIKDGTSQDERLLPALKEGYFNVDEMRLEDLLALSAGFASLLKYYNRSNSEDGDWSIFFESDEAAVLAMLLAENLRRAEADFYRLSWQQASIVDGLKNGLIGMETLPAFVLASKINSWYLKFSRLSSVSAVRIHDKIADVIEKMLAAELQSLRNFLQAIDADAATRSFAPFGSVWQGEQTGAGRHIAVGDPALGKRLKANFYAFHNAVLFLQEAAAEILQESLGRSNHEPAMGLFISFLKLFSRVQQRINGFTRKHLDFYYGEVLKISRLDFVADSTHLLLRPDIAGREVLIEKGTAFRAGVDENNNDLIYVADEELQVNDARVCALHTVYFERDRLISPENQLVDTAGTGGRMYTTGARLNRIEVPDAPPLAEDGELPVQPLFGSTRRGRGKRQLASARLGFALASNVLLLQEGRRDVVLTIRFASDSGLANFVRELAQRLATSEPDAFFKAFRRIFRISLTTATGWLEIADYLPLSSLVDESCEADSLTIRFLLPDSAPAIVGYASDVHGERFDTSMPVLKAEISPESYFYGYSLLRTMKVQEIAIDVAVKRCSDIQVYNQFGRLNTNSQFNPFGPMPTVGNYVVIGSREAACKKLTAFEVELEWGGLPDGPEGFEGLYQGYPMKFGCDVFKANLSVLRDRRWQPGSEERPATFLFERIAGASESGSREVSPQRRLEFDGLCELARPTGHIPATDYGYDALSKDGFFRITLAGPQYAFGHRDYPMVMSQVMTENAKRSRFGIRKLLRMVRLPRRPQPARFIPKSRPIRMLMPHLLPGTSRQAKKTPATPLPPSALDLPVTPLPSQPYTPQVNAISVNYRATATISLENVTSAEEGHLADKIYHLHPLGLEALSPKLQGSIHLVPRYDDDGNLLIGITASRLSGPLTLYFHLRDDSLPEAGETEFGFTWHYLASNRWKKLEQAQVVSDGTRGFLRSGIVALDIPADINRDNTVLPGDLYWLRISSSSNRLHSLCSLYSVYAQALRVSWKKQPGNSLDHLAEKLSAGTISEPKRTIPGIAGICQIEASFGGVAGEGREQWVRRVSERLRHKNRAVTPWDYERLILQRFPELYKVKCFPCMSGDPAHRGKSMPGRLLIAVIPYPRQTGVENMQPMANALLLREVRDFVAGQASAFVHIEVCNPAYERVQVRCRVRLKHGVASGLSLRRLNHAIVDYLSPWNSGGYKARFDWRLHCNDIQSLLLGLDYVESVSAVSLLHLSETGDDRHRLYDTARDGTAGIRPSCPWSIAVPVSQHLIGTMDAMGDGAPEPTGISELSIGNTFVLSGSTHA